jgi:hypothetical protein
VLPAPLADVGDEMHREQEVTARGERLARLLSADSLDKPAEVDHGESEGFDEPDDDTLRVLVCLAFASSSCRSAAHRDIWGRRLFLTIIRQRLPFQS